MTKKLYKHTGMMFVLVPKKSTKKEDFSVLEKFITHLIQSRDYRYFVFYVNKQAFQTIPQASIFNFSILGSRTADNPFFIPPTLIPRLNSLLYALLVAVHNIQYQPQFLCPVF